MTPPVVVKVGGTSIEDPVTAPAMVAALASWHAREAARGSGIVLVHGGGRAVDRLLEKLSMPTQRREGIRITPSDQADVIAAVLAGQVNKRLAGAMMHAGVSACGVCLGDARLLRVEKATRYDFDPGRVGEVMSTGHDMTLIGLLLSRGIMPIVSSIALDAQGEFLNVNADDAAAGLAAALKARSLVLMTDVAGVKGADGRVISHLSPKGVEELIAANVIQGGMIVKARAAATTARATGLPVVVVSGMDASVIDRLAAGEEAGTRFSA
jgi:acetylglutamate kinase